MTVRELIAKLQIQNPDAQVLISDGETEWGEPGWMYGIETGHGTILKTGTKEVLEEFPSVIIWVHHDVAAANAELERAFNMPPAQEQTP